MQVTFPTDDYHVEGDKGIEHDKIWFPAVVQNILIFFTEAG